MNDVLVGVDPHELSVPALVWAADEAAHRAVRLRLVTVAPPLKYGAFARRSALLIRAQSALATAEDLVRELHAGLWTATEFVDGAPVVVLRERTAGAALAVMGSRRLGRVAEVLGEASVAVPLAAGAHCPVVVVRAPERPAVHPPLVVVGVDGGPDCRAAIGFAVAEAALHEARLRAVWVWPGPLPSHEDAAEALADRRRSLAEAVAGWAERYPEVPIEQQVVRGRPVEELSRVSYAAVAVVVGRGSHGGRCGGRLGSTVHGVLHRAACPVVVVPPLEA
ncbi:universal stress protein [Streptomyces benahoarensis]|uniref:Universal stress protein n=1 Tax=Streptomyces benahoarensis TaxID=2595054 RepID=A0A553ZB11_9ACTN|nr:universal stress protein [Streptomyces benahoarensis]TSB31313.1 universal stress protein [Streptomyces benahoarensis]TSB38626.1 universal stress protein [Streptomyces benahoarensis]